MPRPFPLAAPARGRQGQDGPQGGDGEDEDAVVEEEVAGVRVKKYKVLHVLKCIETSQVFIIHFT